MKTSDIDTLQRRSLPSSEEAVQCQLSLAAVVGIGLFPSAAITGERS